MRTSSALLASALVAALGTVVIPSTPALAKSATLHLEYTFDTINASVTPDTSGKGHNLTLNGNWSVAAGVSTPAVAFAKPSLGNTRSRPDLNPGVREFAVTATFRLPSSTAAVVDTPNLVQKGFYGDAAQWKMQLNPGPALIECRFKGNLGARLLSSTFTRVDDGNWHTATCWRQGKTLGVTVDSTTNTLNFDVGSISNGRALQVGAKSMTSTSDQFPGIVDYVGLAMGKGALEISREHADM